MAATYDLQNPSGLGNFFGIKPDQSDFEQFLASNKMDMNAYRALPTLEQTGIASSFKNLKDSGQLQGTVTGGLDYNTSDTGWLGGTGMKTALGVGQLGLGLASFLGNKKTAKLQREDLRTQIASNKELLDTRRKRAANISAVFG